MLYITHANRLESLLDATCQLLRAAPQNPLEPVSIVVPSKHMGTWLQHRFAEASGIAANLDLLLPAKLTWEVARRTGIEDSSNSPFAKEPMTWAIVAHLHKHLSNPAFSALNDYLATDPSPLRYFNLCQAIADAFDQYLVYRPDWIQAWEREEIIATRNNWQPALWRILRKEFATHKHRGELFEALKAALTRDTNATLTTALPRDLIVFGVSNLPKETIDLLSLIAQHCSVHLLLLNPCQEYWFDVVAPKTLYQARIKSRHAARACTPDHRQIGNALLASWANPMRAFFAAIADLTSEDTIEDELFETDADTTPSPPSILHSLQNSITTLSDIGNGAKQTIDINDRSIQIHSCHSPMREVEVLRDQLLNLLDTGGLENLRPRDIVVMVPDIATYGPFIHTVFGSLDHPRLPWSMADRSARVGNSLLETFFAILKINKSRFELSRVLAILENPQILEQWKISTGNFRRLRHWLREVGVRWGIDNEHVAAQNLPITGQHTWEFGINRLLLGYTMQDTALFRGIRPTDFAEGQSAEVIGAFLEFFERLKRIAKTINVARKPTEWATALYGWLAEFFGEQALSSAEAAPLQRAVADWISEISAARFDEPIAADVVISLLTNRLDTPNDDRGFLDRGITFCTLRPLRSVPFRVVCLLGMGDQEFPRRITPNSIDLIASDPHPRVGDRNARDDDRQLFLESLLSARDVFYISYVGRSIRDDSIKTPSVMVAELIDYLADHCSLQNIDSSDAEIIRADVAARLMTQHPMQPFSSRNYDAKGGTRYASYDATWLPSDHKPTATAKASAAGKALAELDIKQLVEFYRNPAKHLLRYRFGITFFDNNDDIIDDEPYAIDKLQAYRMTQATVESQLGSTFDEQWQLRELASGALPLNLLCQPTLAKIEHNAEGLTAAIRSLTTTPPRATEIDLQLGDTRLTGSIGNTITEFVDKTIRFDFRPGAMKGKSVIDFWIPHLALTAQHQSVETHSYYVCLEDKKTTQYKLACGHEFASEQLRILIATFHRYQELPMPFITEASFRFAAALQKQANDTNAAVAAAVNSWNPPFKDAPTDADDPSYRRVLPPSPFEDDGFKIKFGELAKQIFTPYLEHVEELS